METPKPFLTENGECRPSPTKEKDLQMFKRITIAAVVTATTVFAVSGAQAATIDLDNLVWSVPHLIDTSQVDFGQIQSPEPRNNRGLAMDPTGQYLYAGYNDEFVRRIDLTISDVIDATDAQLLGVRGKGIDVDDVGRVYLAEGSQVKVYNADLSSNLFNLTGLTKSEGVAVTREAGQLVLYNADRTEDNLKKWILTESGPGISGAVLDGTFGTAGIVSLPSDPRSVEVDGSGRVWVASKDNDTLYRVSADGSTIDSVTVGSPQDIDFDGDVALVTRYEARTISRLDADTMLSLGSDITVPWAGLSLDPDGQSGNGALSGIVVVPGSGLYISNESGQTADEKSIYGRIDANSGTIGSTFYTDKFNDDNDPILFAGAIPVPAALPAGLALLGAVGLRRRR